jgi:sulfate transport system substrate-binding protein
MFRKLAITAALVASMATAAAAETVTILNASYDVPRKFYEEFNQLFAKDYKARTGTDVEFKMSHGPSGKQGRSVIDGLQADVVTLALANDIIAIQKAGLIGPAWETELPENSSPYISSIIFLVRKGNPKQIKDWPDLIKGDTQVLTPNPKTGGNPRWAYLAAWGQALKRSNGDQAAARAYVTELYKHVPVLDEGARASLTTFAKREIGDVLLAWENEAQLARQEFPDQQLEIVYPPVSILAEPSVAVVDKVVDKRGTRAVAEAYLKFLYTPEARELEAKHYFRPRDPALLEKYKAQFPPMDLFTIDELFGGWPKAQAEHFASGGVFDQIYQPGK